MPKIEFQTHNIKFPTDKVVQKNQNRVKNSKIGFTITKCRNAKNRILNSQHKISHQKWENHFLEEIFHKIWLIIGDSKYNYIAEIKNARGYSVAHLWGKHFFFKHRKKC